jgi:hypothetical protein
MAMIVILCVSVVFRQVILVERRGFGPWARLLAVNDHRTPVRTMQWKNGKNADISVA